MRVNLGGAVLAAAAVTIGVSSLATDAIAQTGGNGERGGNEDRVRGKHADIFDSMGDMGAKTFALRFFDAVTGRPIRGGHVRFEDQRGTTDALGRVTFESPPSMKPDEDRRTATFERDGYVTSPVEVRFMLEELWFNRYSISPKLPPGKIRLVLDWDRRPADLDAHLLKRDAYHISYRDKRRVVDQAALDRDDRDGYGPETITVDRVDPDADYTFYVHDYSNRKEPGAQGLGSSRAHVMIYADGRLHSQMWVAKGAGRVWHVLDIDQGALKPRDVLMDEAP